MTKLSQLLADDIKHWYIPLIIGIIFVIFGVYIFTVPVATYASLSFLFSLSLLTAGLMETFFAIQNHKTIKGWGWYLVDGLLSVIIGTYLLSYPLIAASILPFLVAFTMLFRSFQLLGFAFDLKDRKRMRWGNVAIASVLGIILSFMLLASPLFTGISIVVLTALSFIFIGIAAILLSLDLKKLKNAPDALSAELKNKIQNLQHEVDNFFAKS